MTLQYIYDTIIISTQFLGITMILLFLVGYFALRAEILLALKKDKK